MALDVSGKTSYSLPTSSSRDLLITQKKPEVARFTNKTTTLSTQNHRTIWHGQWDLRQGAKLLMRPLALILWPDLPVGSLASLCPLDLVFLATSKRFAFFFSRKSKGGPRGFAGCFREIGSGKYMQSRWNHKPTYTVRRMMKRRSWPEKGTMSSSNHQFLGGMCYFSGVMKRKLSQEPLNSQTFWQILFSMLQ